MPKNPVKTTTGPKIPHKKSRRNHPNLADSDEESTSISKLNINPSSLNDETKNIDIEEEKSKFSSEFLKLDSGDDSPIVESSNRYPLPPPFAVEYDAPVYRPENKEDYRTDLDGRILIDKELLDDHIGNIGDIKVDQALYNYQAIIENSNGKKPQGFGPAKSISCFYHDSDSSIDIVNLLSKEVQSQLIENCNNELLYSLEINKEVNYLWLDAIDPEDFSFFGLFPFFPRVLKVVYYPRLINNQCFVSEVGSPYHHLRAQGMLLFFQWILHHTTVKSIAYYHHYKDDSYRGLYSPLAIICKWIAYGIIHDAIVNNWSDVQLFQAFWGTNTQEVCPGIETEVIPLYSGFWTNGICIKDNQYPRDLHYSHPFNNHEGMLLPDPLEKIKNIEYIAHNEPQMIIDDGYHVNRYRSIQETPFHSSFVALPQRNKLKIYKQETLIDFEKDSHYDESLYKSISIKKSSLKTDISIDPEFDPDDMEVVNSDPISPIEKSHPQPVIDSKDKFQSINYFTDLKEQIVIREINWENMKKLKIDYERAKSLNINWNRNNHIDQSAKQVANIMLAKEKLPDGFYNWEEVPDIIWFRTIMRILNPNPEIDQNSEFNFLWRHELRFDNSDPGKATTVKWLNSVVKRYNDFKLTFFEDDESRLKKEKAIVDHWLSEMKKSSDGQIAFLYDELIKSSIEIPKDIENFVQFIHQFNDETVVQKVAYGDIIRHRVNKTHIQSQPSIDSPKYRIPKRKVEEPPFHINEKKTKTNPPPVTSSSSSSTRHFPTHSNCYVCGGFKHNPRNCSLIDHPDANSGTDPWVNTTKGKIYVKEGFHKLPHDKYIDNHGKIVPLPQDQIDHFRSVFEKKLKEKREFFATSNIPDKRYNKPSSGELLLTIESITMKAKLYSCYILFQDKDPVKVQALIDTGNFKNDLIDSSFLVKNNIDFDSSKHSSFRLPFLNSPMVHTKGFLYAQLNINNDISKQDELIDLNLEIVDNMMVDLIIGRSTYERNYLHDKLRSHFLPSDNTIIDNNKCAYASNIAQTIYNIINSTDFIGEITPEDYEYPPIDSEIYDLKEPFDINIDNPIHDEVLNQITFGGSNEFQIEMKNICLKYIKVFCKHLEREPAKLDPLKLEINEELWYTPKNRRGARIMSPEKLEDLKRQVDELMNQQVIRPSQATHYSQVVLVKKPDNSWRFCVDFRNLNDVTNLKHGWPIPNIQDIINRISSRSPIILGKGDFTKGYWQALMDEASKKYTSFITPFGCYEWNRVGMGLSSSASYYQFQISQTVLKELVGDVVEHYIDDVLIYSQNEKEFLYKLDRLLQRLDQYNIYLNPSKCIFGVDNIEFLGYEFDRHGRHMSQKRINQINDFPEPRLKGQLKSFLGSINYFHSFIPNQSIIQQPLIALLGNYSKKNRLDVIQWTIEARLAFKQLKDIIIKCPQLNYIDENKRLILQTDACDYGIGAFLFQIIEGEENINYNNIKTIGFFSKALSKHQLNWSTIEKEAYAIIASIKYWDYLLSGRNFLLQTDHKNLIYISETSAPKVIRWKLALQEYSFQIEHIEGSKNILADFLSRVPTETSIFELIEETKEEPLVCCFIQAEEGETSSPSFQYSTGEDYKEFLYSLLPEAYYDDKQYEILNENHNSFVGHFGVDKTLQRLRDLGHNWNNMRYIVRRFIRNCPICQKLSREQPEINIKPFTTSALAPMQIINIDNIGPLRIQNEPGPKYIY